MTNMNPFSLTTSENEIMKLMAKGFSSRHIADKLCISEDTVESLRKNILKKLSGNMDEALACAFSNKLS